jgi:adsorption protein B
VHLPAELLALPDAIASALMAPLSAWIVLNGVDDLAVDVAAAAAQFRNRSRARPVRRALLEAEQARIAVFVPCWKEDGVIGDMIRQNRERLRYSNCDFFIGVYPNDEPTLAVVRGLSRRYGNVHVALCPHDGPTSKADCLNWAWQHMLQFETEHNDRFDVVVIHDAEDVIHPDSLLWINWYRRDYDMIQVPVLPVATPVREWTHGIYCDEFSEFQARDMPAREWMGSFVPSNGVGTGFRREALDSLGAAEANRIFDPVSLTEDYENGLRLRLRGARQIFVDTGQNAVATRELFPDDLRRAVRQRTRWVTGIALQTWDRHGWKGGLATRYWLWRDRKGLIGHPASLLTNLLFAYGALTWMYCHTTATPWRLGSPSEAVAILTSAGMFFAAYRAVYRMICVARRFGPGFAAWVPLRIVLANFINSLAAVCAVHTFLAARLRRQPLKWVKTAHQYPSPEAIVSTRRKRIGEILVMNGYISVEQLNEALATRVPGMRLGERLVELGYLDENALYEALSLQAGLPQADIAPSEVPLRVARSLPAHLARKLRIIPVKAQAGELVLAGPELPAEDVELTIGSFTTLRPRFWLVTPSNYERLVQALL